MGNVGKRVRILKIGQVVKRVGYSKASIYRKIADGSFPKQSKLGVTAVGWLESDINDWILSKFPV